MHKWTEEELTYLREIAPGNSREETRRLMSEKFNHDFTLSQIISIRKRYNIRSDKIKPFEGKLHIWTEEEKAYLREIAQGRSREEMRVLMNEKFDYDFTLSQIVNACNRFKIKNGRQTTFQKGQTTWNKGLKGVMKANKGSFKKGNIPAVYKPVGSERIASDGYHHIKVADPNVWKYKHVVIWEEANGPLPEGHVVLFADGDKNNLSLDNLLLVSRKELAVLNKQRLIYEDKDLTKVGLTIAKLKIKTQQLKKDKLN